MNVPHPVSSRSPVDILLVEDSRIDRMLTVEALKDLRVAHAVHCVPDGEEALDFLRRRGRFRDAPRPDMILLDLNLPRLEGGALLAEIKADEELGQIPVLVLTTSSAEEDVRAAYAARANGFVTKPVDPEHFGRVVRAIEDFWFEAATLPPGPGVRPARASAAPGAEAEDGPCRVLLVEDSASDALLIEAALAESRSLRFTCERAERLSVALGRLREEAFDAIVTDLCLPDSEGDETLRQVLRAAGGVPVIVLTVMDDEQRGLDLLRAGARDCLVKGELGAKALGRALRQAVDRARVEERLRQVQRMESIGVLAGGVAHEFNNLLTVIRGNAELISLGRLDGRAAASAAGQIMWAADRGAAVTRQLLTFGRRERLRPVPVELNAAVREFAATLRRLIGPKVDIAVRLGCEPLPLLADPGMIEQVMMNLVMNARDAMPGGGGVTLETRRVELGSGRTDAPPPPAGPGAYARLTVLDTGAGIPAEVLPHVFEPFFTTKETGKGSGLGLAMVYGVVRQHRGEVTVKSLPGQGSAFDVWLPLSEEAKPEEPAATGFVSPGKGETVLLVEDEDLVREMAATVLRMQGYEVIEAANGVDALARWDEVGERVDVLLTDLLMPGGMTGDELILRLREKRPDLRVVLSSGHGGSSAAHRLEGVCFVPKPYTLESLNGALRRALQA